MKHWATRRVTYLGWFILKQFAGSLELRRNEQLVNDILPSLDSEDRTPHANSKRQTVEVQDGGTSSRKFKSRASGLRVLSLPSVLCWTLSHSVLLPSTLTTELQHVHHIKDSLKRAKASIQVYNIYSHLSCLIIPHHQRPSRHVLPDDRRQ